MAQKMTLLRKVPIRIDFEEADAEKFSIVKKYLGLRQNTEVIRALISEKYNEIQLLNQRRQAQLAKEAKAMGWLEKGEYKCPM
ncbi:MAG: hypothetical protein ACLFU9_06440 [Candidatus Bathyarchaeia archaeon]